MKFYHLEKNMWCFLLTSLSIWTLYGLYKCPVLHLNESNFLIIKSIRIIWSAATCPARILCNALLTHLGGGGLTRPLWCPVTTDSIWFYSPHTQTEKKSRSPVSHPPVTGPTSCCDINSCVFPYVPYVPGLQPSFIHSVWKLGALIPVKPMFYWRSFVPVSLANNFSSLTAPFTELFLEELHYFSIIL